MTILLTGSSDATRAALRGAVDVLGHSALEAGDGDEVLEVLRTHHPDVALLVLDWQLGGLGGEETLRRVRVEPRGAQIPVLVLLPEGENVAAIDAIHIGASDCLACPFTQQDLVTRMLECLTRAA